MGREYSIYEGGLDRSGMCCLGRVISVDAKARRCRVKTIGMPGANDLDLYNVRWLHMGWHPEGDEETYIPRAGTFGPVIFVGSEPILLGAIPLDMTTGESGRKNQKALEPGDKIIRTIANNHVILRSGGTIEVQSTEQCRTYWIPSQNIINSVCQNYELETSGGFLRWTFDRDEETTNLKLKVWNKMVPTHAMQLDVGTVPDDETLFLNLDQGAVDSETNEITKPNISLKITNDGDIDLRIGKDGEKKVTLNIKSATGDITMLTEGSVTATVKKDVTMAIDGAMSATVKKDVSITTEAKTNITAKADVSITTDANLNATVKGNATISTKGNTSIAAKGKASISADGGAEITSKGEVSLKGTGGVKAGSSSAPTMIDGAMVALAGGGAPVARLGDMAIGIGNLSAPVVSNIIQGSPKVTSG